jgi:hypothetical protein
MKPRKRERPAPRVREEHPTEFTRILERLLKLEPSILAAVLVDNDGEAVDYAGVLTAFDAKVAAAHLRLVLCHIADAANAIGQPTQILVRSVRRSFLIHVLAEGYALVMVLKRNGFGISPRALAISEHQLSREAGWSTPQQGPVWHPVHVETAFRNRRRPLRMLAGSTWQRVEVLGSIVGLGRERGYRCRLRSGAELTLVREPAGTWYADELVDELASNEDEGE